MLCIVALTGCASAPVKNTENVCEIFEQKRSWYKASTRAQKKWGTSLTIPMAIMNQESSFRRKARPPRRWYFGFIPGKRKSSAYGYAQVLDGTWKTYQRATGEYGRERDDFADALDFTHWYMRQAITKNGVAADDAYRLYLNYHEGLAGYRRKSYQNKDWLLKAAQRVDRLHRTYAEQYQGCRKSLSRGWLRRWLGW